MATYDLYCSIQDFTPAFSNLRLALNIERERLKLWAECMGIDRESGINERFQTHPTLLETIKQILIKMNETFNDSAKMLEEYQGAQSPASTSEGVPSKSGFTQRFSPFRRVIRN